MILLISQDWETQPSDTPIPLLGLESPFGWAFLRRLHCVLGLSFSTWLASTYPSTFLLGWSLLTPQVPRFCALLLFLEHLVPLPIPLLATLLFSHLASPLEFEFFDGKYCVLVLFFFFLSPDSSTLFCIMFVECITRKWKQRSPLLSKQGCQKPNRLSNTDNYQNLNLRLQVLY